MKRKMMIIAAWALFMAAVLISCSKSSKGEYYAYQNSNAVFDGTAYAFLQSQSGLYDSMLYALDRITGIKDSLTNNTVTLFAVPNTSFTLALKNLNANRAQIHKAPLYLSDLDSTQLDTLLCKYILPLPVTTDSINSFSEGKSYGSIRYGNLMNLLYQRQDASGFEVGGPQQIQFSDTKDTIFQRFWISTTTTSVNIHVNNGIVHIISGQHEFGFGAIGSGVDLEMDKKQE